MKMVAASKLRRAQQALLGHRPYANHLNELVNDIISRSFEDLQHPLMIRKQQIKNSEALIYSSNKGLCAGFNGNLLRYTEGWLKEQQEQKKNINLEIIGRKGRDFFKARKIDLKNVHLEYAECLTMDQATDLAEKAILEFLAGKIDSYYIIYNQFVSAVTHKVTKIKLLPITLEIPKNTNTNYGYDFIYEPNKETVVTELLQKYVAIQIYRAHLESLAAELGARMAAMETATTNAGDMISHLTLQYNRARQAAITTELMDIVSGAEALR